MKSKTLTTIATLTVAATALCPIRTLGHGWYPKECCHDMDCAPVEDVTRWVPTGGGIPELIVSSKHGRVLVPQGFPVRASKDGRMHVCMVPDAFGAMTVTCLFVPPSM